MHCLVGVDCVAEISQDVHFVGTWTNILYDVSLMALTSHGDAASLHAGYVADSQVAVQSSTSVSIVVDGYPKALARPGALMWCMSQ